MVYAVDEGASLLEVLLFKNVESTVCCTPAQALLGEHH
jgi:hypothetical protein